MEIFELPILRFIRYANRYIVFCVLLGFVACEDVVTIPLQADEQKVYIDATLEEGQHPRVVVGYTQAYNKQGANERISGARVSILDHLTKEEFPLVETDTAGLYTSYSCKGQPDRLYTLKVESGGVTYTASDTLYGAPTLDEIRIDFYTPTDANRSIIVSFTDNPNRTDYYRWLPIIDTYALTPPKYITIASDLLFDGKQIKDLVVYDGRFLERCRPGAHIILKQFSLSAQTYQFFRMLQATSVTNSPFAVPPANIPSNFSGGALGNFRAMGLVISDEIVVAQ